MESDNNWIYLSMVKRLRGQSLLLEFFVFSFLLLLTEQLKAQSFFMVLEQNSDFTHISKSIENSGGKIRQSVPPMVIIAEFEKSISPREIQGIQHSYTNVIPMRDLKTLGLMEKAAGIEWNKSFITDIKTKNPGAMGVMSLSVANSTLYAPDNLIASIVDNQINVSWTPVDGALITHIQVSKNNEFPDIQGEGKTGLSSLAFPLPTGDQAQTYFIRARSGDRPDANDPSLDNYGEWTSPLSLECPTFIPILDRTAPTPTSPVNDYESIGFTVILEWSKNGSNFSRLQLSAEKDFQHPWLDSVTPEAEFIVPSSALHVNDRIFWRVQAYGNHISPWSGVRSFTIKEPSHHDTDMFLNPEAPR